MKKLNVLLLLAVLLLSVSCQTKEKNVRLAFIAGMNPEFNYEMYKPLLENLEGVTWNAYTNEESQELFKPENKGEYDVIVFYDICLDEFPEASRQDLVKVIKEGKPVFVLHDGLLTYNTWPEFAKIAGMKYFMSAQEADGVPFGVSTYKHNQVLPIKVVDTNILLLKEWMRALYFMMKYMGNYGNLRIFMLYGQPITRIVKKSLCILIHMEKQKSLEL